ncbi:hypothetical protein ACFYOK_22540 [Microbispora bryophytorum]|uniref:hypothetical protein n=1 Tax=Microbispora bryophytorum TaxID=1460882 RepID=UPI0033EEDD23
MNPRTGPSRQQRAHRSQQLRARGLTWDQIAAVWETDCLEVGPRVALRWAHNLSHQEVADRWNALDIGEPTMVKARIYQFEHWPAKGRRPSLWNLHTLARIYQVHARRLLNDTEYALYSSQDRQEIDRIDYRRLDENFRDVVLPACEVPQFPGSVELAHPATSQMRDRRALSPEEQLELYARESSHILGKAECSNVGSSTIERLNGDLQRIAVDYLKVPTGPLLRDVRRVRDEALRLLEGHQPLRYRKDLYLVAGWAMTLLAWISTDLGRPGAAISHTQAAWHFAEETGHDDLRAWICKSQQVIAYWDQRKAEAVRHAQRGLGYARRTGGETELMLASTLALDYARLGRPDDARRLLHRAQEIAPETSEHFPGGPLSCSSERALSYWSDTSLVLSDSDIALAMASRSVAISQGRPMRDRNLGTERMTALHIVRAHINAGALDGASEALRPVLETPPELRAAPLLLKLDEIANSVPASAQGKDIREGIRAFRSESRPPLEE